MALLCTRTAGASISPLVHFHRGSKVWTACMATFTSQKSKLCILTPICTPTLTPPHMNSTSSAQLTTCCRTLAKIPPEQRSIRELLCSKKLQAGHQVRWLWASIDVMQLSKGHSFVDTLVKGQGVCVIVRHYSGCCETGLGARHTVRNYSSGRETVEKKLLQLIDMWEVEEAVALLRGSVEEGVVPHPNVILNLQQQLANLGEVEYLLELHDFLKEHKLISDTTFFHCLQEAYYNSGRVSEGVEVLQLLYHRTRKFSDVDVYFTLLTVMVLDHFPERLDLILSFVTDLKEAEEAVLEPGAALWKCYMMAGKWTEADNLLVDNQELRPLLPQQVARICQGVDRVEMDQVSVLTHMLDLPFIRQKLRVLVAETLITELVGQKQWPRLLKALKKMKSDSLPLHVNKLSPALDDLQRYLTPQYDKQLQELKQWCTDLLGEEDMQ